MFRRINHAWRVFATACCFAVFGIGCLLLRITVFPAISLWTQRIDRRTRQSRRVIQWAFRGFVELMQAVGILDYRIVGRDKLDRRGLLLIVNHPTLIDVIFLIAFVEHADCIIKGRLWDNPFTRGPVRAAGYIRNSDGVDLLDHCCHSLAQGNNLIVFPEGTRTPSDSPIRFKRGAANISIRGRQNLTPVFLSCDPPMLRKNEKWWKIPDSSAIFTMKIGDDIDVRPFLDDSDNVSLTVRRLTRYLQDHFNHEYERLASTDRRDQDPDYRIAST